MQRSQMVPGTEYAVNEMSSSHWATKYVLLSAELHRVDRRTSEISKAKAGEKATTGSYYKASVGVLMEDQKGVQKVVYPAHVRNTWEGHVEEEKMRQSFEQEKEAAHRIRANQNEKNSRILAALWEDKKLPGKPYFSAYDGSTNISYETLIALLERIPD